jgi:hypothetical protein
MLTRDKDNHSAAAQQVLIRAAHARMGVLRAPFFEFFSKLFIRSFHFNNHTYHIINITTEVGLRRKE